MFRIPGIGGAATAGVALALGCGGSTASPPRASIMVDRATCEAGLTVLTTIDPKPGETVQALAVGSDGTVFFSRGSDTNDTAIYALAPGGPSGGAPIASFSQADRAWVDGNRLWLATVLGQLYVAPLGGPAVTLVGQIPQRPSQTTDQGEVGAQAFVLDATYLYLAADRYGVAGREVWRVPRAGGDAELLYSSQDGMGPTLLGPLLADSDALYYVDAYGGSNSSKGLMRLPKTGGTPTVARMDIGFAEHFALFGTNVYADALSGSGHDSVLGRFHLDSTAPGARIDGVEIGMMQSFVTDGAGAYIAFDVGSQTDPGGHPVAFARLPTGTERSIALGCTATPPQADEYFLVRDVALDGAHLYAIVQQESAAGFGQYTIVRMAR